MTTSLLLALRKRNTNLPPSSARLGHLAETLLLGQEVRDGEANTVGSELDRCGNHCGLAVTSGCEDLEDVLPCKVTTHLRQDQLDVAQPVRLELGREGAGGREVKVLGLTGYGF